MMENKFIGLMVGLTVGVLMVSGFLWPVVSDATTTETKFVNEGYYTMDEVTETTTSVIEWEKANPNTLTIDGTAFDMSWTEVNKSYTVLGSDSVILRYQRETNTTGIQMFSNDPNATYTSFHLSSSADTGDKATITVSSNSVTFITNGTSGLNRTVANIGTDAYIMNPDNDGEYTVVMKQSNKPAYLKGDSTVRFMGVSVGSGPGGIAIYGVGSIDDGMTLSTVYSANTVTNIEYSDPVATDTQVNGYEDLWSLDKYTFTISFELSGTPTTYDATYSYFIIPAEVTAEKSWHLDTTQIALVAAIGTLGAIVLIAAAAGSIRRLD